jgi:[CysO sulfur-carrier protein]-S-L-cysteine hydrolase
VCSSARSELRTPTPAPGRAPLEDGDSFDPQDESSTAAAPRAPRLVIGPGTSFTLAFGLVRISQKFFDEVVAHARDEAPNECCGYMRLRDGAVEEVVRAVNERHSPYGYELDHKSLFAANELDERGYGVGIYHSHPRSPAEPSQTDINLATYPHWTYLIVSLENGDAPVLRGWRIADGRAHEEPIDVGG